MLCELTSDRLKKGTIIMKKQYFLIFLTVLLGLHEVPTFI